MRALLKMEFILTKRSLFTFIMGIGMPVLFFLLFSSMFDTSYGDTRILTRNYLITMTAFSMSSFALFSFPALLETDKKNNWLIQIQHSPISLSQYYTVKVIRVFVSFIISIIINFIVGFLIRNVTMSTSQWLVSALLLLVGSSAYLAIGLLLTLFNNTQTMSVFANILYFVLAIFGGSWMPYEVLPKWMQQVAHFTPSYHANQLVLGYLKNNKVNSLTLLIVLAYAIIVGGIALILSKKQEVR
ncbi:MULTISPECIES: ABC transporter permease [unclassified Facklamia]|uniref:ABC transporter permease n=1 Tax=Aerococcaceae TaxID=186827 RepID=UPI0013B6121E|nr:MULTISPECIES: ABC transporter permease [unclassified Facklamia]NEW65146.1 ABC transporter permease [Facklamia sp. 252]NEW68537.1 ABC transporter permease [Facklamia sp. 253]QQD65948.1 ABC transporter permease [Aerococcaceae bacterium zg-252]